MFDINFYTCRMNSKDVEILCNVPWYKLSVDSDGTREMMVDYEILGRNSVTIDTLRQLSDKFTTGHIITVIEAIKNGPKVIKPTFEQCLALGNVEVDIPYDNYKQTYPALFIEFPYKFYEWLERQFGLGVNAVTTHQLGNTLCVSNYFKSTIAPTILFTHKTSATDTLELSIRELTRAYYEKVPQEEKDSCQFVFRIMVNLNLLITSYGHEIRDWADPKRHKNNPKPTDLQVIAINQKIKIYNHKEYNDKGGTHASPTPHWRRGHWRNQPVREGHRQVFIAPMFIGKKDFIGNFRDTRVEYSC